MNTSIVTLIMLCLLLATACNEVKIDSESLRRSRMVGSATNNPPVLDALVDETVAEGSSVTTVDLADGGDDFDVDNNALTYSCVFDTILSGTLDAPATSCSSLPGAVAFSSITGVFNWTPDYSASGHYEIWFTATDGGRSDTKLLTYSITNVNQAPILDAIPTPVTSNVSVAVPTVNLNDGGNDTDVDGTALTYSCLYETTINGTFNGPGTSCSSLPGTVSLNPSTGVFNWTPTVAASGTYELWFTASDGSLTHSRAAVYTIEDNSIANFNISGITGGGDVTQDNKLDYVVYPVITWETATGATSYDVRIFEADGSTLVSCGQVNGVSGTSYNFSTCALTRGNEYKVRVSARSGGGGAKNSQNDLYTFEVNNLPIAINDGPYYVLTGGNIAVSVLADNLATPAIDPDSDPDGDAIAFSSKTHGTKGTTAFSGTNIIYTPSAGQVGMDTFTYTINDGRGGTATGTVTIYVISGFSWLGAVNSDWNNPGNWCGSINATKTSCAGGSTLPGSADNVTFNSSCINCNVNINTNIDVNQFNMQADFPGTISQNGNTIRVRAGWTQNGGTFTGGNANIRVDSFFQVNGGLFTSTSAELELNRDQGCCGTGTNTFLIYNPAGFAHNNGTVRLDTATANGTGHWVTGIQINANNANFYNLIIDAFDYNGAGGFDDSLIEVLSGHTISVQNHFTMLDGRLSNGRINILGDASFECSTPEICSEGGASGGHNATELVFMASFPLVQNINVQGTAALPSIHIAGTSTINLTTASNDLLINGHFKQTDGVFTAPSGWMRLWPSSPSHSTSNTEGFRLLGGTFNSNGMSLYLNGHNKNSASGTPTVGVMEVPFGFTVSNFHYDHNWHGYNSHWDLQTNVINVSGNFVHTDGDIIGTPTFMVSGDVTFECVDALNCAESNNSRITLVGTGVQNITQEPGAGVSQGLWTVSKPSGSMRLTTPLVLDGAGQDLNLDSGIIDMDGFNLTVKDGTPGGNVLTLGPNTQINRGTTPGTIDADSIVQDPSSVINPP